jgi:hypothetical protein
VHEDIYTVVRNARAMVSTVVVDASIVSDRNSFFKRCGPFCHGAPVKKKRRRKMKLI